MKKEVKTSNFSSILHPFQATLLTTKGSNGKENIISIAWMMPIGVAPPALVFAIRKERYSYKLLCEREEFVVNIPSFDLLEQTMYAGTKSGKQIDKFIKTGLTTGKARVVSVPIIQECIAHIECTVRDKIDSGLDHVLVIGNVVACYAESDYFDKKWITEKVNLLLHLGGDIFTTNASKSFKANIPNK
ncbi:MAG: flavin reductase family protein [Caldisericaceae bacterium]